MSRDYLNVRHELYRSIRNIVPTDREYDWQSVYFDSEYRTVSGYGPCNPICNAIYHDLKKTCYVSFRICPGVDPYTKVCFPADDEKEASRKMNHLIELIMLTARTKMEYYVLTDMVEREIQAWEWNHE